MPFQSNLNELNKTIELRIKDVTKWSDERLRWLGLSIYAKAKLNSPVDTGALRASWNISRRRPNTQTRKRDTIQSLRPSNTLTTIFITNALPYAPIVEYGVYTPAKQPYRRKFGGKWRVGIWSTPQGFSTQAPNGMLRLAIGETLVGFKAEFKL